jgi:hypothetical protein
MDTFDGSKPNLISSKTLKDIESKLDTQGIDEGNRVLNGLGSFYDNYISPNMFPLIVIMLLVIYLTIKYILKKDREEREDEEEEINIKRKQIKKQMVNVDPDEVLRDKNIKPVKKEEEISDMISNDYLLTDDDSDNNELDYREPIQSDDMMDREMMGMNQHDMSAMLQNRDTVYDMDKVAALVFGKG